MALGVTDLRKGAVFSLDGTPYQVLEYSQKVVGRGGSIVSVRIKNLQGRQVLDRTFKGNEQLDSVDLSYKNVQYLYKDDEKFYFMDNDSFEQFDLSADALEDLGGFMKEGDAVKAMLLDGRAVSIELPKNVYLKVVYTEDVVRGDTTSSITKPAKLETGVEVRVPPFIKVGDVISVDTTTGAYRERKKD